MASNQFLYPPVVPSLASAPGTPVNGMSYYDTTLAQYRGYANSGWVDLGASGGGGGSSDLLSTLVNTPVSITGETTATISKMHVCSGTSVNYTVTLPSPSGNANKLIGFRMSPGLTKFVTLDAGASVSINGVQTRLMWANESVILLCDGSNWFKIGGITIPMSCNMIRTSSLSSAGGAIKISMDATASDPTGAMTDTDQINIIRPGNYLMIGTSSFSSLSSNATNLQAKLAINGSYVRNVTTNGLSGGYVSVECMHTAILNTSDKFSLYAYTSIAVTFYTSAPYENQISVLEMPSW